MAQNSQRLAWTSEEVDRRLKGIMSDCYEVRRLDLRLLNLTTYGHPLQICLDSGSKWSGEEAKDGVLPSLLSGANVAGFVKVADAMKVQGDWW